MTIQNEVDIELWEIIKKNYVSENFAGAILDSIFKLTDTIRNKTGLEGDGSGLIGQAFGGDNPRIKLNKLQTDSEKDIQKGVQEILRGIYTAIRNPRSHDAIRDAKSDADAIIIFISYLLGIIDKSKLSFEEEDFLVRVFDPYFVKTSEYSDLLVQEIPKRQRANIAISTILKRNRGDKLSLSYFLTALFKQLDEVELTRVYIVISDELRTTTNMQDITFFVHACPGKLWNKIEKSVRLRTESILYEDFSHASYNPITKKCGDRGAHATWISEDHLMNFSDLVNWTQTTVNYLKGDNKGLTEYVDTYFWRNICETNKADITYPLKHFFRFGLMNGKQEIIDRLKGRITWVENHPWWKVFEEELKSYPDIKFDDELPF